MLTYVIVTDDNPDSGVLKKARYQVATLNSLGIRSELHIITSEKGTEQESSTIKFYYYGKFQKLTLLSRFVRAQKIRRIISDIITSLDPEDIFYYRGLEFMIIYYPRTFFRPFRKCRILSEHQSIEINQHLLYREYGAACMNVLTGSIHYRTVRRDHWSHRRNYPLLETQVVLPEALPPSPSRTVFPFLPLVCETSPRILPRNCMSSLWEMSVAGMVSTGSYRVWLPITDLST